VADSVGSQLRVLADQVESGEQESPDCLVTGLTGLSLAPPAEFGSASAGADLLPRPEGITADGTPAVTGIPGSAFHRRTCGFWRDFNEPGVERHLPR
jgi:hypothetical protein